MIHLDARETFIPAILRFSVIESVGFACRRSVLLAHNRRNKHGQIKRSAQCFHDGQHPRPGVGRGNVPITKCRQRHEAVVESGSIISNTGQSFRSPKTFWAKEVDNSDHIAPEEAENDIPKNERQQKSEES